MVRTFLLAGWLVWLFSIGQTESFSMTAAQPEPTPRARYLNPNTGRFWSMDSFAGNKNDPRSLHKYLYCHDNPINNVDPTGLYAYLLFWGEEISNSGQEVPFEDAAKTQEQEIHASSDFDQNRDEVHIIQANKSGDVNDALKHYKQIKQVYFFVHHSPGIMHLSMTSDDADTNISKDGGPQKRRTGVFSSYTFQTVSFTDWDKSNCLTDGELFIFGCHSKSLAKDLGLYMFGKEGQGIGTTCYYPRYDDKSVHPMGSGGYIIHLYNITGGFNVDAGL